MVLDNTGNVAQLREQIAALWARTDFRCRPTMTYSQCSGSREVLEPRGLSTPGLARAGRVKEGQGWNAHGVGLSSPKSRTSATSVARTSARRIFARRKSFAARPDEPVASFALISSIMPRGAGQRPQTYRIALTIALVVALIAAIFGAMPIAVLVAAFAVPVVYIVYIYDVNLWEDEPLIVTGLAFLLDRRAHRRLHHLVDLSPRAGAVRHHHVRGFAERCADRRHLLVGGACRTDRGRGDPADRSGAAGQSPRVRRPDGRSDLWGDQWGFVLLLRHSDSPLGSADRRPAGQDPGLWVSLIFLEGFVKPMIIGTASGIAVAEFSGLGRGYDGFTPRYFRGVGEAILANAAYQAGTYLFSFVGNATLGVVLSILWGLIILAILILRVRNVLARRADGGRVGAIRARPLASGRRVSSSSARSARCRCWIMPPSATPVAPRYGCNPRRRGPRWGRC